MMINDYKTGKWTEGYGTRARDRTAPKLAETLRHALSNLHDARENGNAQVEHTDTSKNAKHARLLVFPLRLRRLRVQRTHGSRLPRHPT